MHTNILHRSTNKMNVTGFSRFTVDWSSTAKIYRTSKNQQHVVDGNIVHSRRKVDQRPVNQFFIIYLHCPLFSDHKTSSDTNQSRKHHYSRAQQPRV